MRTLKRFRRGKAGLAGEGTPRPRFKGGGGTRGSPARPGAYLFDEDGRRYIDYVGSFGPLIAGHAHPEVVEAVREAAGNGLSFGAPTAIETEMAETLCRLVPSIERVRLCSSGTEAAMSAIRLARGYTGRDTLVKFEGCYHGHADSLLIKAGSGALTLGTPSSPGVPEALARHTVTLPYNDFDAVEDAFGTLGNGIAAVIVEPVAGNMNCVPPLPGFLEGLRRICDQYGSLLNLAEKAAIQLNDTHPAIAIAELMRLLIDEHHIAWEKAWEITRATTAYTNHTLLPEALESWPVHLIERLLPRHMQIVYAINAGIIADAHKKGMVDFGFLGAISLIDENNGRRLRMGQLAFVGTHSTNGVSGLHSGLMKETVFKELNSLYPGRINNKTNGITPRRWLQQVNPGLTHLVREAIGPKFLDNAEDLITLDRFANDVGFLEKYAAIKRVNKQKLSQLILQRTGIPTDPSALFDVQIKRIHEYKRQLLAILETIALYNSIRAHPGRVTVPRVKIFAGKAAASYWEAKTIIRLINDVGTVINADPAVRGLLKVVFIPNYNVTLAETIVPAADISEQISTAGMEASGTGNMKLAINGALTVGTLDGANVEISEHAGLDNVFIFGLTAAEVAEQRKTGPVPRDIIDHSPHLKQVIESIRTGYFRHPNPTATMG